MTGRERCHHYVRETVAVTTLATHNVLKFVSVVQRNAVPLAGDVQERPGRKAGVLLDAMQRGFLGAVEAVYDAAASPAAWSRALATIAAVAEAKAGIHPKVASKRLGHS